MKVKIFDGKFTNEIEDSINTWLSENDVNIFHIKQTESSTDRFFNITITMFYTDYR